MEFKIKIGERFKEEKRDITITDIDLRPDKNGRNWKWYKYTCNICGFKDGWNTEHHILNGIGCSCCDGRTVVKGINDVATTHPEYVKYFANVEDAYKITHSSRKKVLMKCPNCGALKEIEMTQFDKYGLACNKCSDGISYPEKFVYSMLEQLGIHFISQFGKKHMKWCGSVHYDFYLPEYNCIIETHGEQHYKGNAHFGFKSFESEHSNDENKKHLALDNGIKYYFEIDSRNSNLLWMKESIINSGILGLLGFTTSDVIWDKCQEYTLHSLMISVCNYKNTHPIATSTDISNIFHIHRTTAQRYMQRGSEVGICCYDRTEEIKRKNSNIVLSRWNKRKNESA